MSRFRRRPLLGRTGWLIVGTEIAVVTVVGVVVSSTMRTAQLDTARGQLVALGELAAAMLRDDTAAAQLADLAARHDARFTWLTPAGDVVDTADVSPDPATLAFRPEFQGALAGREGMIVRRGVTLPGETLFVARLDGKGGVIRVAKPVDVLLRPVRRVQMAFLAATVMLVLLTVVALVLATRRLRRSAERLAHPLRRFAHGDMRRRRIVSRESELDPVANAMDDMSASLLERLSDLDRRRAEHGVIIDSMTSGLIALDREERVIRVNRAAARIFGFDATIARRRLVQEIIRDVQVHAFIGNALARGTSGNEEMTLAGGLCTIKIHSTPLSDTDGSPIGVLLIIDDVTQLRRLEAIRSDFAANVSHELRTPITSIKGYVETLLELGPDAGDQQRQFLAVINHNTERLEAIVEDLLLLARLESTDQRSALARERLDVATLLDTIRRDAVRAEAKSMTLRLDVEPGLEVVAVPQLLQQALSNLVVNAINYAPAGTTITLSGRTRKGEIELAVTDEGPGIEGTHLPRLFERFYRVDAARSREVGGTGLGLAIVKHIAIAHGGRATADSVIGQGSVFRILLPAGT